MKTGLCLILCAVLLLFSGCTATWEKKDTDTSAVTATTTDATDAERTTTTVPRTLTAFRLRVPVLSQFPSYPTGCESVSAVMALRYAGEPVTVEDFIRYYLEQDTNFYYEGNYFYGPDPRLVFAGDPRTTASYGCMAPVIRKALIRYFGSGERVVDATGATMKQLCQQYVAMGVPVCVWVSINMQEITPSDTWITPAGETYTWPGNEHCMLLIGYDEENYYFNDPYKGEEVSYPRSLAESRYETMGRQAIAVLPE